VVKPTGRETDFREQAQQRAVDVKGLVPNVEKIAMNQRRGNERRWQRTEKCGASGFKETSEWINETGAQETRFGKRDGQVMSPMLFHLPSAGRGGTHDGVCRVSSNTGGRPETKKGSSLSKIWTTG